MRTTPREVTREDIGWLSGIIDGEGSIYAAIKETYPYFRYSFQLVNTNKEMLNKFQSILKGICGDENAKFPIFLKKYSTGIVGKKQCYALQIRRIDDLKKILTVVLPHLTEKRNKATYLLTTLNNHKKFQWYKKEGLTPVETKRTTLLNGDEAIVRTA
jgi:hypothetical protein